MRLFELPEVFRAWERAVEEAGGVTDELAADLDRLHGDFVSKADAMCCVVRELEDEEERHAAMAREFRSKASAAAARAAGLRAHLARTLRVMGLDGVKGRRFSCSLSRAGRPSIRWAHGRDIPEGFAVVDVRLDGEKAQMAYRLGALPEGFEVTFAETLRIR